MTAVSTPRYQFQAFPFHLVEASPWPILTANAVLSMMIGAVLYFNGIAHGTTLLTLGFFATLFAFILWFRDVTTEGTYLGDHTLIVQKGLTMGVSLFIVTEVFFFISIFWAYFHSSLAPTVELGSQWTNSSFEVLSGVVLSPPNATLPISPNPEKDNNTGSDTNNTPGLLQDNINLPYATQQDMIKAATDTNSNNMFAIAKRFAATDTEPTADIINLVQDRKGSNRVTPEQVALFKHAFEHHTKSLPVPLGTDGWQLIRSMDPIEGDTPGCYIVTYTKTGDQGVGSSMKLGKRVSTQLATNYTGTRIAKHLNAHGRDNHNVQVVRLPLDMPQTISAVLAFEQYLFLRLNPTINLLFIAGSGSLSNELMNKLRAEQGEPVYVYYKGTLVHQTLSVGQAALLLDITRDNVRVASKRDSYLDDFNVTMKPILDAPVNIMEVAAFKALLAPYRERKLMHLYISGYYIDSYVGIKGVMDATGFTKPQVSHAIARSQGLYNKNSDILFSWDLIDNAPVRVMTDIAIAEYCANARKLASQKKTVYVYNNGQLVNKFDTLTAAYDSNSNFPVSYKMVHRVMNRDRTYTVGNLTYTLDPIK